MIKSIYLQDEERNTRWWWGLWESEGERVVWR